MDLESFLVFAREWDQFQDIPHFLFLCLHIHKVGSKNRQANGFTPEVEDEVIRDAVLHKLDIPLVDSSNKVCIDSTQTKSPPSPFHIGLSLKYTNGGHNEIVDMVDIKTNDPDRTKHSIQFFRGNIMIVTRRYTIKTIANLKERHTHKN